ncbi:MAG: trigger factor [Bryobacteraceae bacterium]
MALVEGCRHSLEISIPAGEVESETSRVVTDVQKRAKLPGFRPGKVPASLIRKTFAGDVRQKVLESLVPKYLQQRVEAEGLVLVGRPDIGDVHFHDGEPLTFKATFEVEPTIELGEYTDLEVPYHDPEVTDEDVEKRLTELREQKAQFVNVDPRPAENGDFAVLALESLSGVEGAPIKQDEMVIEMGGGGTLPGFTENLLGVTPGDEREFDVAYPEDYASERVAGKTVRFRVALKGIRRKELPDANDEFAQDLGDYRDLGELRDAIRRGLFANRQFEAQREAKNRIIEKLLAGHDFAVPEEYVARQIRNRLEQRLNEMAGEGVDIAKLGIDWKKAAETQHEPAEREVKASLLISRIADREAIHATKAEVDREVEKIARQAKEPLAAAQRRLEKDGTTGRIANHIRTEKTLTFLFERARKTVES